MRTWSIGVLALMISACGDDPQGPEARPTVDATVTIDWPRARETGFVDAMYTISHSVQPVVLAEDSIPPGGVASAQVTASCGASGSWYSLRASGRFEQWVDHSSLPEGAIVDCVEVLLFQFADCSETSMTLVPQPQDPPRWECVPPVE